MTAESKKNEAGRACVSPESDSAFQKGPALWNVRLHANPLISCQIKSNRCGHGNAEESRQITP